MDSPTARARVLDLCVLSVSLWSPALKQKHQQRVAGPHRPLSGPLFQNIGAGPQAGRATMRLHDPLLTVPPSSNRGPKPFTAARHGFSLNCAVACEVHERAKLERVCRYMARGPIAQEHLSLDGDGLVVLELKRAFSDGPTHVLFEPQDFTARLAALGPRPKAHLVRYHGVFAPSDFHTRAKSRWMLDFVRT